MTEIFYLADDAIARASAQFGEETRPGGGVVFNVKWRRYTKTEKELISRVELLSQF